MLSWIEARESKQYMLSYLKEMFFYIIFNFPNVLFHSSFFLLKRILGKKKQQKTGFLFNEFIWSFSDLSVSTSNPW